MPLWGVRDGRARSSAPSAGKEASSPSHSLADWQIVPSIREGITFAQNPRWARVFVYANLGNKKNAAQGVSMETGF